MPSQLHFPFVLCCFDMTFAISRSFEVLMPDFRLFRYVACSSGNHRVLDIDFK